jgi:hypothetical protein
VPKGSIERVGLKERFSVIKGLRPNRALGLDYKRGQINNILKY